MMIEVLCNTHATFCCFQTQYVLRLLSMVKVLEVRTDLVNMVTVYGPI
jgi:hypothetical protein